MKNRISIPAFLLILFVIQACNVYQKTPVGVEEAVRAQDRVKIVTTDKVFYEFKRLQRQNGELMGITTPDSDTAAKLTGYPQEKEGRNIMIPLDENRLEYIYLRNRSKSRLLSYGIPAVLVVGTVAILAGDANVGGGY